MRTSTIVWIVVALLVVLGAGWYFYSSASSTPVTPTSDTPQPSGNATSPAGQPSSDAPGVSATVGATVGSAPMSATVTYNGSTFSPASLTIAKGGTVTFTDTSGTMWLASDPHPVHTGYDGTSRSQHCVAGYTGPKPFDECSAGSTFTFTFDKTGSWGYHDHLNDSAAGTVTVQ